MEGSQRKTSLKKFPVVNDSEVVLLRAELNTGYVLDNKFERDIREEQTSFTVFGSVDEAFRYAKSLVELRKDVEFWIYNKQEEVVGYVSTNEVKDFH